MTVAGFVLGRYARLSDVISIGWLPIVERRDYHLAKLVFKAIHFSNCPSYLKLEERKSIKDLRSSTASRLVVPIETGTFQDQAARVLTTCRRILETAIITMNTAETALHTLNS